MDRLATFLSVVAVGLGGYAVVSARGGDAARLERLEADLDALRVLETRIGNLEAKTGTSTAPRPVGSTSALAADVGLAAAPKPSDERLTPPTVEELVRRVAAVEAQQKQAETRVEERLKATEAAVAARPARALSFGGPDRRIYGSLDDASADLDLSASQKAEWERAIADAKRDLEELRRLPDEEGKTWDQVNQEMMKGLADGTFRIDGSKAMAFRNKTIPGRSETYGQADQRIRTEARRRLKDPLSTEQQAKFDKALVDPLLGGSGATVAFSTINVVTDDGKGAGK